MRRKMQSINAWQKMLWGPEAVPKLNFPYQVRLLHKYGKKKAHLSMLYSVWSFFKEEALRKLHDSKITKGFKRLKLLKDFKEIALLLKLARTLCTKYNLK